MRMMEKSFSLRNDSKAAKNYCVSYYGESFPETASQKRVLDGNLNHKINFNDEIINSNFQMYTNDFLLINRIPD